MGTESPAAFNSDVQRHQAATSAPAASLSSDRIAVLLAQYEAVADHHMHFMTLIWQVPAVTSGIGGILIAIGFGTAIPLFARALIMVIGASIMVVMTIALERYRMFQLRRRKDLQDIEAVLKEVGAQHIAWDGSEVVREIRRGEFSVRGLPTYRWEGFKALRAMMYVTTAILVIMSVLTALEALGFIEIS